LIAPAIIAFEKGFNFSALWRCRTGLNGRPLPFSFFASVAIPHLQSTEFRRPLGVNRRSNLATHLIQIVVRTVRRRPRNSLLATLTRYGRKRIFSYRLRFIVFWIYGFLSFGGNQMNRRGFILGAAGLTLSPAIASAQVQKAAVVRPTIVRQQCAEWCWAASASMVFAHLGHPIDQMKIVQGVYGAPACQTAQPVTITRVLSRPWIDDRNQPFQPQIEAGYDQLDGINTIGAACVGNAFIVNELMQNRMLLYANTHHCMALVEVDYIGTPAFPK
jgi:hypothetical protein